MLCSCDHRILPIQPLPQIELFPRLRIVAEVVDPFSLQAEIGEVREAKISREAAERMRESAAIYGRIDDIEQRLELERHWSVFLASGLMLSFVRLTGLQP